MGSAFASARSGSKADAKRIVAVLRDGTFLLQNRDAVKVHDGVAKVKLLLFAGTGKNAHPRRGHSTIPQPSQGMSPQSPVDVGVATVETMRLDSREKRQYEIDFVVNRFSERVYVQSAWMIPDEEKRKQETFSLRHVNDNFRKVVITGDPYEKPWMDDSGITFIGIVPFLLDPQSLETL